jgi:hypothetical protein
MPGGRSQLAINRPNRGFVEEITCTAADWIEHADALRAATPLRKVTLVTWPGLLGVGSQKLGRRWQEIHDKHAGPGPHFSPHVDKRFKAVLEAEFPGIDFQLEVTTMGHATDNFGAFAGTP